ncbi:MAG: carboxypeptidase-like regulatory domain-containing protein, partial [Chitinophagaceae bacterium]|nr:carboxypeptidase-like regulatory domain-containing protein [Chitinophagaceae bacterium]
MNIIKRLPVFIVFLVMGMSVHAQKKTAMVEGKVIDEYDQPLKNVSVHVLNSNAGTVTNDSGYFSIRLTAEKPVALVFSYTGLLSVQRQFLLNTNEKENITIKLKYKANELQQVEVSGGRIQNQTEAIAIDAQKANFNPSPIGGIEGLIKTLVGSSNELTSQYTVRGGNYDENLVYVNDYEIYRPFLVSNGQQEGLSFINQDLTGNVKFYVGGFQAKYGDKMSSALDVTYRKPLQNAGSAYIGLIEQGLHLEGISKNKKFTYLIGVRNKNNRNILSSQQTSGVYIPSSSDVQGLFGWQLSNKWQLELYGNYSQTGFTFYPQSEQLTADVFSPLYTASYGADISFEGRE